MKHKSLIYLVIISILVLSLAGCSTKPVDNKLEKHNIGANSLVLEGILKGLYKNTKVEPIMYREQNGADKIFEQMGVQHDYFESYAFLYNIEKPEYILIMRSEVFYDEYILKGVENITNDLFKEYGDIALEGLVYDNVGEFIVFIKHEQALDIFKEIEKGIQNWDITKVTPVI